jgi:hypothetical protein
MAKTKTARRAGAKKAARAGASKTKTGRTQGRAAASRSPKKTAAKKKARKAPKTKGEEGRPQFPGGAQTYLRQALARWPAGSGSDASRRAGANPDRERSRSPADMVPTPPSSLDLDRRPSAAQAAPSWRKSC